jgi:hypothetical protein
MLLLCRKTPPDMPEPRRDPKSHAKREGLDGEVQRWLYNLGAARHFKASGASVFRNFFVHIPK